MIESHGDVHGSHTQGIQINKSLTRSAHGCVGGRCEPSVGLQKNSPGVHVLSILEAVFIVSPKRPNLGSLLPTRPLEGGKREMDLLTSDGRLDTIGNQ